MTINERGFRLICDFEGCVLKVYLDAVGLPTVGVGHRTNLPVGTPITQTTADTLLHDDLERFESGVEGMVTHMVTDNQFSALVCLAFNIGLNALKHSTLLRKLNAGDVQGAADQFLVWNRAATIIMPGLTRRRQAERELFLS